MWRRAPRLVLVAVWKLVRRYDGSLHLVMNPSIDLVPSPLCTCLDFFLSKASREYFANRIRQAEPETRTAVFGDRSSEHTTHKGETDVFALQLIADPGSIRVRCGRSSSSPELSG